MNFVRRITNPDAAPLTFLAGVLIPIFAGCLVVSPPAAVITLVIGTALIRRHSRRNRRAKLEAIERHRQTWGF